MGDGDALPEVAVGDVFPMLARFSSVIFAVSPSLRLGFVEETHGVALVGMDADGSGVLQGFVPHVLRWRDPFEVFSPVVEAVAVDVVDHLRWVVSVYKRLGYEGVNMNIIHFALVTKTH